MLKVTIGLIMQCSGKKHQKTEFEGMTQQSNALNNLAVASSNGLTTTTISSPSLSESSA
jgi:hypothetical protein